MGQAEQMRTLMEAHRQSSVALRNIIQAQGDQEQKIRELGEFVIQNSERLDGALARIEAIESKLEEIAPTLS